MDSADAKVSSDRASRWWLAGRMSLVGVAMFGFGFALVPLYEIVCEITGFNGTNSGLTLEAAVSENPQAGRDVRVEFLTSVNRGVPMRFAAERDSITVTPGKLYTVEFVAENQAGRPMTTQARPSVAPGKAARYVRKTECFCFSQQTLETAEVKQMPVRFMVDPELPDTVDTVTLSYTFFEIENVARAD